MEKIILSIDPGLTVTGFSVLSHKNYQPIALEIGFVELGKLPNLEEKLVVFENFLLQKIQHFTVTDLCIETPFLGKNAQTFLKLGYLRGILLLTAKKQQLTMHQFAPASIKLAITGSGNAQKEQVARAVGMLFPQIQKLTKNVINDVTDALAIGLCGIFALQAQKHSSVTAKLV